jgi:hypothetical protein
VVELVGDPAHVRFELGEQLAHAGREARAAARDDRERVVERRAKEVVLRPRG